jgi:hypothetical protein
MRWFRDTIRQGTWLALFALAINLGLSFGHIHAMGGKDPGRGIAVAAVASVTSSDGGQRQNSPDHSHADELCPICMAAAAMANSLVSAPPALPTEFANVTIDRTIEPVVALVERPRAAFQSRGPPIS